MLNLIFHYFDFILVFFWEAGIIYGTRCRLCKTRLCLLQVTFLQPKIMTWTLSALKSQRDITCLASKIKCAISLWGKDRSVCSCRYRDKGQNVNLKWKVWPHVTAGGQESAERIQMWRYRCDRLCVCVCLVYIILSLYNIYMYINHLLYIETMFSLQSHLLLGRIIEHWMQHILIIISIIMIIVL